MNRTTTLFIALALATLLLCAAIFRLGVLAALPKSEWTDMGAITDFPSSAQPHEVFTPVHVFIINNGQEIVVIEPMNPVYGGMNVRWNAAEDAFIDPLRGSWFDLYGRPVRRSWVNSIVEDQGLSRYSTKIEGDHLWIDLSQPLIETVYREGSSK